MSQPAEERENEIVGLLNWSVNWVRVLAIEFAFLALQSLVFAYFSENILDCVQSLVYAIGAYWLFRYAHAGKTYISTEADTDLGKPMGSLSAYLSWLTLVFFTVVVRFALPAIEGIPPLPSALAIFGVPLLVFAFILFWESRAPYRRKAFSENIGSFARRNVFKTCGISFFSLALGVYFFALGIQDGSAAVLHSTALYGLGISFLASGVALFLFWRALREIHRNPVPIYFERTLAQLGFYWLIAPISTALQFVALFFSFS